MRALRAPRLLENARGVRTLERTRLAVELSDDDDEPPDDVHSRDLLLRERTQLLESVISPRPIR